MADDKLNLKVNLKDHASAGVKKLGKNLNDVRPSNGMAAAKKWMGDFRQEAEKAGVMLRPVSTGLNALGVGGLAAGLSLGEIVKQMRALADSTLTMKELGRQSRMSATDIARLQYAAGKLHVDPAAVGGAVSSWSSKMVEFRMHTSEFYRYLMRQNADVAAKIGADNPVDGLKDSLDYLSRIKDPQIQKRVADMAGLGDLVPMLGKGPQGLSEAFADASRQVKPISDEMVAAAEKLNDSTNRLNQSWLNLENTVGPSIIDPMTEMIGKLEGVFKEGEKIFGRSAPETAPPRKPDGSAGESTSEYLMRTFRNTLRTEFSSDSGIAQDGKWLWENLFGTSAAHADELRPGMRAMPPTASAKWAAPSRYDAEARIRGSAYRGVTNTDGNALRRNDEMPVASLRAMHEEIRQGSKEGIVAGLREMAQQQELGGEGGGFLGAKTSSGGLGGSGRHIGGASSPGASLRDHALSPKSIFSGKGDIGKQNANTLANGDESMRFWMSKGLSADAAAGLVGMEQGEALYDPNNKTGDSGNAHGSFQWHKPRRDAIRAATGIDIDRATHAQQLEAAYWEFTQGTDSQARQAWKQVTQPSVTAPQAAAIGTTLFERPGDKKGQSLVRGRFAQGWLKRHQQNTGGAGTPAPSPSAQTAADAFKAHQKAINGTPPVAHTSGGWIKGAGGPTADRVPAMLSNGEFVVNARASGKWGDLLHAINSGDVARFADGGPVGFGVARQFYPTSSPGVTDTEGHANRRFWREFMRKPRADGGMGANWRTTIAALAMMQGESGRGLNSKSYGWDVNGPSGGVDQLHDVTTGRAAGRLHRLSDLMTLGMQQHADWRDPWIQAANFKREALGDMGFAWRRMAAARSTGAALKEGIDKFENPANHGLEMLRRMPNIVRLQREAVADRAASPQELGPLDVTIRHHPHTGHPIVTARAGKGLNLKLRTAPTMRPT